MLRRLLIHLTCSLGLLVGPSAFANTLQAPQGNVLVVTSVNLADFEGPSRDLALKKLSREIYARYRDQADFLVLMANRRTIPPQTLVEGYHYRVSNTVRGIGASVFNAGREFGGTQRLQGILYFPRWTSFWRLPLLHELAHQWANEALPTTEPGHFGFCGAGSQLGGFDPASLKSLGRGDYRAKNLAGRFFGTAANGANTVPYSNFELYLMGLADPSAVAPIPCAVSPKWINMQQGTFKAAGMTLYDMPSLIKRLGPRVPDFKTSPKTFRLMVVLLSEKAPSAAELRGVQQAAAQMVIVGDNGDSTYSFFEATKGRGRLELISPNGIRK